MEAGFAIDPCRRVDGRCGLANHFPVQNGSFNAAFHGLDHDQRGHDGRGFGDVCFLNPIACVVQDLSSGFRLITVDSSGRRRTKPHELRGNGCGVRLNTESLCEKFLQLIFLGCNWSCHRLLTMLKD